MAAKFKCGDVVYVRRSQEYVLGKIVCHISYPSMLTAMEHFYDIVYQDTGALTEMHRESLLKPFLASP